MTLEALIHKGLSIVTATWHLKCNTKGAMFKSSFQRTSSSRIQSDSEFLHAQKDNEFDIVYPLSIREQSPCHWSPVNVCRLAAKLLVQKPGTRVLDIGCGPGKFCMIGAATTQGHFTGVEQRGRLVRAARELVLRHSFKNVEIIHGNITGIDFIAYDAFYLFNPFEENVFPSLRIDFEVEIAPKFYAEYVEHVRQELAKLPAGTRVITYCGDASEIPAGYDCQKMAFDDKLKLWVKRDTPAKPRRIMHSLPDDPVIFGRGSCGLQPT